MYLTLALACVTAAVLVALLGAGDADDLLAVALVGLAGTLAGRGGSGKDAA
jgi:hypothetical protein